MSFHDEQAIELRLVPPPRWVTSDDTEMAVAVVDVLRRHGGIEQGALASAFAGHHAVDPYRGCGPAAHDILHAMTGREGIPDDWLAAREPLRHDLDLAAD
jgi:ADP-ribosylglycohydrolase